LRDTPSTLLKGMGILLILIGVFGVLSSAYAIKVVSDYDLDSLFLERAESVKSVVGEASTSMEQSRADTLSKIENTSSNLDSASTSIQDSSESISSASGSLLSSSENLSAAGASLRSASASDRAAARYLDDSAEGLESWADNYDYNGTALPGRRDFVSSVRKISDSASEMESSAKDTETAAAGIENTATGIERASEELGEASEELGRVGEDLAEMRDNVEEIGTSIDSLISDLSGGLNTSVEELDAITGYTQETKLSLYAILSYFLLLNFLFIGIGVSLLIVDVNLFYS